MEKNRIYYASIFGQLSTSSSTFIATSKKCYQDNRPSSLPDAWNQPGSDFSTSGSSLPAAGGTWTGIWTLSGNHNDGLCSAFVFLFFFFPFIFISWRLITLQYCSGFCHTLTWISHGFTCAPHSEIKPTPNKLTWVTRIRNLRITCHLI